MAEIKTSPEKEELCKPKTCPECGGLGCFERPRYFCGQLLTDKDLDAAQRYVIDKNKLHNRYLFGSGVVCGLAVKCDHCKPCSVTIEPGYAIDCCGNDIVLCEPAPFNVCEYIEKCLREKEPVCEEKIRPSSLCDELPKEYCLTISYDEEHTRPITALIRDNGCSVKRCEPSRTRETFRFDLIEKQRDPGGEDTKTQKDFWSKVTQCMGEFLKKSKRFFLELNEADAKGAPADRHIAFLNLFCRLKDDILKLYKEGPNVRCTLEEELTEIESSFPANLSVSRYDANLYHAVFQMYGRLLQHTIDCICDAMLVPCTECDDEKGVILACITVHNGKIEKICNNVRKQILTGPALRYWLQPIYTGIDKLLDYICCELDLGNIFDKLFAVQPSAPSATGGAYRSKEERNLKAFHSTITRGETGFRMARDYFPTVLRSIRTMNLLQFMNPDSLTAMDVYNLPLEVAKDKLKKAGIPEGQIKKKVMEDAYKLMNLQSMAWIVPFDKTVQLITDENDVVVAIRIMEEDNDDR